MERQSLLLLLAMGALSAAAVAQQIVIEPTNGKVQSATTHVTRPAAKEIAPAPKADAKASPAQSSQKQATKRPKVATAKAAPKDAAKSVAAKTEVAKNETHEIAPAPAQQPVPEAKKFPSRPAWAMNDTRDAQTLQDEITSALVNDAKLKQSSIRVRVSEESVTLEGRGAGSEERLEAVRLAQSYAWNRKVVDHIEVAPRVSAQK